MRAAGFAGLCVAVIAAIACAPPAAQESSTLAAMDETWEQAYMSGDPAAVASIYSDDARLFPPNGEMTQGKEAVEAVFGEMMAAGLGIDLQTLEAMESGDLGYSVGTYELTGPDGNVVDRGKYMDIFRKVGGEWKMTNDIWNSDMPAGDGAELIITHDVMDNDRWQAAWAGEDGRRRDFAAHGAPSVTIYENPNKPSQHALAVEVSDMDAFMAWVNSDAGSEAKAADGVKDKSIVFFTKMD